MKRMSIGAVILIMSVLPLAGCVGTAQGKRTGLNVDEQIDREKMRISPAHYLYPTSQGVIYLSSEQFLLCRKKDFCPIEGHFTPVPPPSQEKTAPVEPPRKRLDVTMRSVVHFASGRTNLEAEAQAVLDQLMTQLDGVEFSDLRVVIAGYTDDTGPEEMNKKIALERAEAVAARFRERGFTFKKVVVGGRPLCCYVAPNTTAEGRAKNRRVEIWIEPPGETKNEKAN